MIYGTLIIVGVVLAMGAIGAVFYISELWKKAVGNLDRSEKILADLNQRSEIIAEYEKQKGVGRIIPDDIFEVLSENNDS